MSDKTSNEYNSKLHISSLYIDNCLSIANFF